MEENIVYKKDIINVDGTAPDEIVIEKHGGVVRFTLREVENADKFNRKNIKELTAKREYESAVMANIENNNKYGQEIKDMEEELRYTVHLYQEAAAMTKAIDKKLEELQTAVDETEAEIAEIKKQIPEVASIPSPFVPGAQVGAPTETLPVNETNKMDEENKETPTVDAPADAETPSEPAPEGEQA